MTTYIATYVISNGEISLTKDGTQTLNDLAGQKVYLRISKNNIIYTIDLARYMLHQRNIDLSSTLTAIVGTLTDAQILAYTSTDIPTLDPDTGALTSRINAYDAATAPDLTVSWTSIGSPGIRNDVYRRASMNDLVLSSKSRDLSNSLVAVNGVFHKTYLYNKELYVQDGYANIKNTRRDEISVYDTTSVGGHTILPIRIPNIDASNKTPHNGVTLTFCRDVDFTNKTLLLVIGGYLHALDGTYRIIAKNRIVVDICKLDLIDEFIHNPNTIYTKAGLAEAVFEDRLMTHRNSPPTVYDKIMYYLWNKYPTARAVTTAAVNFIAFDPPKMPVPLPVVDEITFYLKDIYPWSSVTAVTPTVVTGFSRRPKSRDCAPTVHDKIYAYLEHRVRHHTTTEKALLIDYEWTPKYETLVSIIGSIPMCKFKDDVFVYNTLLSPHTFFVVVDTPILYKKQYELVRTQAPGQYVEYGKDTPRGIMLYNRQHATPYVIYTESMQYQHNFSTGHAKTCLDVYKTALNPPAVPSPLYDLKDETVNYPAGLLELYSS